MQASDLISILSEDSGKVIENPFRQVFYLETIS